MLLEHIAKGYIGTRHDGDLYLMGRICEPDDYVFENNDLFLPWIGGIMVPDDLQQAIINRTFTGRLVPYYMLEAPMRVLDEAIL